MREDGTWFSLLDTFGSVAHSLYHYIMFEGIPIVETFYLRLS